MPDRQVLLTFDLEEFDIPLEFGTSISLEEQLKVGNAGMNRLKGVLENFKVPATLFTTANYAIHFPQQVKELAQAHEIASHTFYHSSFSNEDLLLSKNKLEEITGKPVYGLRMPRMKSVDMDGVKQAGYLYDSSVNPTLIPGKYNNLHLPPVMYREKNMWRFPCSVSPLMRIPLFWLSFKNFPYFFYLHLVKRTIAHYGYVHLYFHPWEFTDISNYGLPSYVKRNSGENLVTRLINLIKDLRTECTFVTVKNFLSSKDIWQDDSV